MTLQFLPDYPAEPASLNYGRLNFDLLVHSEVVDALDGMHQLRDKVNIILQCLAVRGQTNIVKGINNGINRGWRRSPLGGGSSGMHYYLWWALSGTYPLSSSGWARNDGQRYIVVRGIRHHDNHNPINVGDEGDYYAVNQRDIDGGDNGSFGNPWTSEQLRFASETDPVRVIHGLPGSGKTWGLWKALESRGNQRVLYLTWSRNLAENARERFNCFAPEDAEIDTLDFVTFLSRICGYDVPRIAVEQSQQRLWELLADWKVYNNELSDWANHRLAFYAALRGDLFGAAVPGAEGSIRLGNMWRLSDAAYLGRTCEYSTKVHRNQLGRYLLQIVDKIKDSVAWEAIFPELAASAHAIERLRDGELRGGLRGYDRVVVDEIQDLTLLEIGVIVELCEAMARRNSQLPWLLAAGDDGQTVRPTAFDWGGTNNLLSGRLANPKDYSLEQNLRSPAKIVEVIDRVSVQYKNLSKSDRPTNQQHYIVDDLADANLFHVGIAEPRQAVELLRRLNRLEYVVIVTPQNRVPEWVPGDLRNAVLTPDVAKGLEYQTICVLEPGEMLKRFNDSGSYRMANNYLDDLEYRTAIDQFRVAISRATELLAFIDVAAGAEEIELSEGLLVEYERKTADELIDYLIEAGRSTEERVRAFTEEAGSLFDTAPARGWERICQAVGLLDAPDFPAEYCPDLCETARLELLSMACRMMLDGFPLRVDADEVVAESESVVAALAKDDIRVAFRELKAWASDRGSAPFGLLDAVMALGGDGRWLQQALPSVYQTLQHLIETGVSDPEYASLYFNKAQDWLRVAGYSGDVGEKAQGLLGECVDTLLDSDDVENAVATFAEISFDAPRLTGRVREAQGKYGEAAEAFERAGLGEDARRNRVFLAQWEEGRGEYERAAGIFGGLGLDDDARRNWRLGGSWQEALPLAGNGAERADLQWLADLEGLIARRPSGHAGRLTDAERRRLSALGDALG